MLRPRLRGRSIRCRKPERQNHGETLRFAQGDRIIRHARNFWHTRFGWERDANHIIPGWERDANHIIPGGQGNWDLQQARDNLREAVELFLETASPKEVKERKA